MIGRRVCEIVLSAIIAGALYTGCLDPAAAQQNVQTIGPITTGDIPIYNSPTIIKDSGFSPGTISGGVIIVTTSIQAAYNTCPGTGGTIIVPVGYTETFSANLTLNKAYCGVVFLGPATLTMGTNSILIGASVDGVFFGGSFQAQSSISGVPPVGINIVCANTTGACVSVGNSAQRTNNHTLKNVVIDIRAASAGTIALNLVRTVFWNLDHVTVAGGNQNATGVEVDGTAADLGGFGYIIDPQVRNMQKPLVTTGAANSIQIIGGLFDCNSIASSTGGTRDGTLTAAAGLEIYGTEFATCTTGISMTGIVKGDSYLIYTENNTTDISAGASTLNNTARFNLPFTQSNSGTNNDFQQVGSPQGAALSVRGVTGNATAAIADIIAASDGNVLRRSGTSVGFGAINLGSGNAVSSQLPPANGGTGVNNGSSTFTIGGNFALSGAFTFAGTLSNNTAVTFPTAGTLATVNGNLGIFSGASLALNGCTIGTDKLCVSGTSTFGDSLTVLKTVNATLTTAVTNTDNTNSSSRALSTWQAGNVIARILGIATDGFYMGTATANHFNLQVNGVDQIIMDGTTVAMQLQQSAPSYKIAGGATKLAWSGTAPTISSGFCSTTPTISANNGSAAFTIGVGTSCSTSTGVIGMPTASAGWACHFNNVTNPAANTPYQTASTVSSVSVTNYVRTTGVAGNWTASDVITAECTAY